MSFEVQESIVIDRPREAVWNYVIEHDEWRRPEIVEVRKLTEGPHGKGARYEDTAKMMGQEMKVVNEILRFEPPSLLSWTQISEEGPSTTIKGRYEVGYHGLDAAAWCSARYRISIRPMERAPTQGVKGLPCRR
jgi:uncharacterized protein YndB with AHSA1/START domain